jgi:hypothetical protein
MGENKQSSPLVGNAELPPLLPSGHILDHPNHSRLQPPRLRLLESATSCNGILEELLLPVIV